MVAVDRICQQKREQIRLWMAQLDSGNDGLYHLA
jgi:hypothetical protein